jgi:hypothetical protein
MWAQLGTTGQWQGEIWNKRKSGDIYPEELNIHSLKAESGKTQRFVAIFSDITERKRAEQALQHAGRLAQAITDAQSRSSPTPPLRFFSRFSMLPWR